MGTIQASQYNTLQGTVANILGQGSGSYASNPVVGSNQLFGYGQPVTSSQVATKTEITVAQWTALRNDILACYYHQGLSLTLPAVPSKSTEITQEDFNYYSAIVSAIDIDVNRLAFPASGQYSGAIIDSPTKTNWTNIATHTVTVNFPSYTSNAQLVSSSDCARFFFNTGGRIEITPTIAGGGLVTYDHSALLDQAWKTIFNRIGTIYLNYQSTSCSNNSYTSGPSQTVYVSSSIGVNNLTTSYQTILTSTTASGGTYYPNQYVVNAKVNQTPNPSQIILQILFEDVAQDNGIRNNEPIDSTITSTVAFTRASGSYVSVVAPVAINSSFV